MSARPYSKSFISAALAASLGFSVGARAAAQTTVTIQTVTIQQYAFVPASVTVATGTTVEWQNRDDDPHTVKSDPAGGDLKSPALDTNDRYRFTFKTPGTYKYFCTLHPHMQGTIIVR